MTCLPSSPLRIAPFDGATTSECPLAPLPALSRRMTRRRSVTMGIQSMPWNDWIEVSTRHINAPFFLRSVYGTLMEFPAFFWPNPSLFAFGTSSVPSISYAFAMGDAMHQLDREFPEYHRIRKDRIRTRGDRVVRTEPARPGMVDSGHAAGMCMLLQTFGV